MRKWRDLLFCCKLYPPHNLLASTAAIKLPATIKIHLAAIPGFAYNFITGMDARESAHRFGA